MEKIIKTNTKLVISDYNWLDSDLEKSWISKYTDNYFIYDRYHRFEENEKIKWQKNVGQNVYDIFDFIDTNYDNLPDTTIFCRASFLNPKDIGTPIFNEKGEKLSNGNCTEEYFQQICNNVTFTEIQDFWKDPWRVDGHSSKFSDDNGYLELNNSWYLSVLPHKYFNSLNTFLQEVYVNPIITQYVRFSPGANYIIPKENMLKYNRNFYNKMKEYIGWDIITGEAHLFERALYTIFTCDYEVNEKYK